MEGLTPPPAERARSIFADLGYSVEGDGPEFRAERKWRVVRVTATADVVEPGDSSGEPYRCFVTWADCSRELCDRLRHADPDYEWAVIGVADDGYEVLGEEAAR